MLWIYYKDLRAMTAAQRVFSFSAVMGVFFSKHQFVKANVQSHKTAHLLQDWDPSAWRQTCFLTVMDWFVLATCSRAKIVLLNHVLKMSLEYSICSVPRFVPVMCAILFDSRSEAKLLLWSLQRHTQLSGTVPCTSAGLKAPKQVSGSH